MITSTRVKYSAQVRVTELINEIYNLESQIRDIHKELSETTASFLPRHFQSLIEAMGFFEANPDETVRLKDLEDNSYLMVKALREQIVRRKEEIANYIPFTNIWIKMYSSENTYGILKDDNSKVDVRVWDPRVME